jgi:hypothetical protein
MALCQRDLGTGESEITMPRLTVWMVRAALLHLAVGFLVGGFLLWEKGVGGIPWAWRLRALHVYLLTLGWVLQLALGVAFWMLPRFTSQQNGKMVQVRGRERWAWAAFILTNLATLSAVIGIVELRIAPVVAMALMIAAALCFAIHAFPRIKAFRVERTT